MVRPASTDAMRAIERRAVARVDHVARSLAAGEVACLPDFVSPDELRRLRRAAVALDALGAMRPAGIGRGEGRMEHADMRGDRIAWLDPEVRGALGRWTQRLDRMRSAINRRTFAGLFEWEGHVAHYGPGAGYPRHVDRFADHPGRVVSTVLYLNEAWTPADGGVLRLWPDDSGPPSDVAPIGGTFVAFWSAEVPHAVLPTLADRWTITGWFRTRDLG